MKLRGKQKRYLRSQANQMRPIFSVGKQGLDSQWLTEVQRALNRRELIKIKVLANAPVDINEVAQWVQERTNIQVIQKIGKTLLLFAVSKQAKYRQLSQIVQKI